MGEMSACDISVRRPSNVSLFKHDLTIPIFPPLGAGIRIHLQVQINPKAIN